ALELPEKPREVQQALNIEEEGSYILSIKNPQISSPSSINLGEERRADFPKHLQERFRKRRFIAIDLPDFLNYERAESLDIGDDENIDKNLSIDLITQREDESTAEIYNDLRMVKSRHAIKPLFEGQWVYLDTYFARGLSPARSREN